jgi:hypothetical protein
MKRSQPLTDEVSLFETGYKGILLISQLSLALLAAQRDLRS